MPPRPKSYRLPASTGRGAGSFYWVLIALLVAGACWVWQRTRPATPARRPVVAQLSERVRLPASAPTPAPQRAPQSIAPLPGVEKPRITTLPRPPQDALEVQIALARLAICPGSLDGVMGLQTSAALLAFQQRERLPLTGVLDAATQDRLRIDAHPVVSCWVSSNDVARLQPVASTWLGRSEQSALDYENVLELVSERTHANPKLIRRLNPSVNWSNVVAGTELRVPWVEYPEPSELAAQVRISLAAKTLQVFGGSSNLLAHFPCSIAARVENRPMGDLVVTALAPNPNYTFNPAVFPESPEAQAIGRKLIIQPGPNNPVGVAWISLSLPSYGIHGTPIPEQVGRTESHGCFRLANWNAEYLVRLVRQGTPVAVEP